jgi:putative ABC transport system ATP-binding protein
MTLIHASSIGKTYRAGDIDVPALKDVSFDIEAGAFAAFVGPSGSGKTTLLNLVGCLDHPTTGRLTVLDTDVSQLSRSAAASFRGENLGFIFQDFNLVPVLSAWENIEYPLLMVRGWPEAKRRERITRVLAAVGMADQAGKRPDQLSGGQKQRVAVARALVGEPRLVLADEPTANLDHDTAHRILDLMKKMRDDFGTTFVFSTHDPKIMAEAEVTLTLEDGRIASIAGEERRPLPVEARA